MSERCGSRGVKPSFDASPHLASGKLVVMGDLSPIRFGVFFLSLSPRPPRPPRCAVGGAGDNANTPVAYNRKRQKRFGIRLCMESPLVDGFLDVNYRRLRLSLISREPFP